jgi:hypothetical protein
VKFVSIAAVLMLLVAMSATAWFNLGSGGDGNGHQTAFLAAPNPTTTSTGSGDYSCDDSYVPSQGYATSPASATCSADENANPTVAYTVPAKSDCKVQPLTVDEVMTRLTDMTGASYVDSRDAVDKHPTSTSSIVTYYGSSL